jgi:hypothetical protein
MHECAAAFWKLIMVVCLNLEVSKNITHGYYFGYCPSLSVSFRSQLSEINEVSESSSLKD